MSRSSRQRLERIEKRNKRKAELAQKTPTNEDLSLIPLSQKKSSALAVSRKNQTPYLAEDEAAENEPQALFYQFNRSNRGTGNAWTGLVDAELAVDAEWGKYLPSEEQTATQLEKILSLILNDEMNNQIEGLYLSRVTKDENGNYKAWYATRDLSDMEPQALGYNAQEIAAAEMTAAKKDPVLQRASESQSELMAVLFDAFNRPQLRILLLNRQIEDAIKMEKQGIDLGSSTLADLLDTQLTTLKREKAWLEDSLKEAARVMSQENPFIIKIKETIQETNQLIEHIERELLKKEPRSIKIEELDLEKFEREKVEEYSRKKTSSTAREQSIHYNSFSYQPTKYDTYKYSAAAQEGLAELTLKISAKWDTSLKSTIDEFKINRIMRGLLQNDKFRKALAEKKFTTAYITQVTTEGDKYNIVCMGLTGTSDRNLIPYTFEIKKTELEKSFSLKRPEKISDENEKYLNEVKIQVDTKWDKALPESLKNKREPLLNSLLAQLCKLDHRKRMQDSFFTEAYLARAMLVGDKIKVWYANTSLGLESGKLHSFAVPLSAVVDKKSAPQIKSIENENPTGERSGFLETLDNTRRQDFLERADQKIDKTSKLLAGPVIYLNPKWNEYLPSTIIKTTQQDILNKILYAVSRNNENKMKLEERPTNLWVSHITLENNRYKIWLSDISSDTNKPIQAFSITESTLNSTTTIPEKREVGKFTIAGSQGTSYGFCLLRIEKRDEALAKEIAKNISERENNSPIIMEIDQHFFAYGFRDGKWQISALNDLSATERDDLKNLVARNAFINRDSPLLPPSLIEAFNRNNIHNQSKLEENEFLSTSRVHELQSQVASFIEHERETSAIQNLDIDTSDKLSQVLTTSREAIKLLRQKADGHGKNILAIYQDPDQALITEFKQNADIKTLEAKLENIQKEISVTLDDEGKEITQQEEALEKQVSQFYSESKTGAVSNKKLFSENLADPLIESLKFFITKILSIPNTLERIREKEAFRTEFNRLVGPMYSIQPRTNLEAMLEKVDSIRTEKNRDELLEIINSILLAAQQMRESASIGKKASSLLSSLAAHEKTLEQDFSAHLLDNLSKSLQKSQGVFEFNKGKSQVLYNTENMSTILKENFSASLKFSRTKLAGNIQDAVQEKSALLEIKFTEYTRLTAELKSKLEQKRLEIQERRKIEQQKKLLEQESRATERLSQYSTIQAAIQPTIESIKTQLVTYLSRLGQYFGTPPLEASYKEKMDKKRDIIVESCIGTKVNLQKTPQGRQKIEAAGILLRELSVIYHAILKAQNTTMTERLSLTEAANQEEKRLDELLRALKAIDLTFKTAQASQGTKKMEKADKVIDDTMNDYLTSSESKSKKSELAGANADFFEQRIEYIERLRESVHISTSASSALQVAEQAFINEIQKTFQLTQLSVGQPASMNIFERSEARHWLDEFRNNLILQHSEEGLLFLEEVYKLTTLEPRLFKDQFKHIIEDFISNNSPKQINISGPTQKALLKIQTEVGDKPLNLNELLIPLMASVKEIISLLNQDSAKRFIHEQEIKRPLIQPGIEKIRLDLETLVNLKKTNKSLSAQGDIVGNSAIRLKIIEARLNTEPVEELERKIKDLQRELQLKIQIHTLGHNNLTQTSSNLFQSQASHGRPLQEKEKEKANLKKSGPQQ